MADNLKEKLSSVLEAALAKAGKRDSLPVEALSKEKYADNLCAHFVWKNGTRSVFLCPNAVQKGAVFNTVEEALKTHPELAPKFAELEDSDRTDPFAEQLSRLTADSVVLFKMHPWVPGEVEIEERFRDRFFSMNAYPDINELFYITDLLITDYSSIAGDFMLLNRPAVFFQPDRGSYDGERGLYFDPDESPMIVAHTEDELLDILSRPIDGPASCRAFLAFMGTHESGHAAEAVARRIAERLG